MPPKLPHRDPENPGEPPASERLSAAEERRLARLHLRDDIAPPKAVLVALVEEGWRPWIVNILRGLKAKKFNRSANNAYLKALVEAGRLADAVAALLRRLGVDSEEELENIVTVYRQAQRAEPQDNLEMAYRTIEANIATDPEERTRAIRRLGGAVEGGKDA